MLDIRNDIGADMIKVIIFDFGGVLSSEGHIRPFAEKYAQKFNISADDFYKTIKKYWNLARIGEIGSDDFWDGVSKEIGCNRYMFKDSFLEFYKINIGVLEFVKKLKERYKLAILSNTFIQDFYENEIIKKYHSEKIFDYIILSSEIHMKKPDLEMFHEAIRILGIKPEECVFIDDKEENIVAAEKVGMKGILFVGLEDLKEKLRELL